jgi:steroid 5-alpha reductase family enzyme
MEVGNTIMWTYEITQVLLINWGILLGFCALLWLYCISHSDVSIIDRFWGPLCAASSVLTLAQTEVFSPHALLLVSLSCIWALRLSYHITKRNWNAGQDFRYEEDSSPAITHSSSPLGSLVFVFFGQATLAWLISAPVQLGQFYSAGQELSLLAWIGVAVWGIGFTVEMVGDWQLRRFKAKPENQGRIMDQGLWAWTRHPNYFGDSTVWFGLFLIAAETPLGIYSIFGPLLLLYVLVRLTGKALTETVMLAKYPAYSEYIERTSGFFPLPPGRNQPK